jgi:hypothetical protein
MYVKSLSIIAFTKNTTKPKNIKNRGSESILRIGLIVTFITHRIIPPMI